MAIANSSSVRPAHINRPLGVIKRKSGWSTRSLRPSDRQITNARNGSAASSSRSIWIRFMLSRKVESDRRMRQEHARNFGYPISGIDSAGLSCLTHRVTIDEGANRRGLGFHPVLHDVL